MHGYPDFIRILALLSWYLVGKTHYQQASFAPHITEESNGFIS
jgi:hypothetical protein